MTTGRVRKGSTRAGAIPRVWRAAAAVLLLITSAGGVTAQGFAGLGSDAEGFTLPAPDPSFSFPRDHGPHHDFRIEWWYVTANLQDAGGRRYGVQWTLFRSALEPKERPGWASPQIWFAHAAATTAERHLVGETLARGGIGQAGVTADPFRAWIDDWAMEGQAAPGSDALSDVTLTASGPDFAYDLRLRADGPLVFQGQRGFSVKSERGQASYYYSQPHYAVEGRLDLPDGPVEVTGRAWLDREWSSQPLDDDQTGWDWFALHLADGTKMMVYRLRDADGGGYVPGTWIDRSGGARHIPDGQIRLTPLGSARVAGRRVPVEWRIEWPEGGVDVTTRPLNRQAWMATNVPYWEGPISVTGSHEGEGYLEMTGYE